MKKIFLTIIIIFIFLSSCNKKQSQINEKIEPQFDVSINISKDNFITYTIKTNLPDETYIGLEIDDKITSDCLRQDSGEIKNGTVIFGPYENMQNLTPGEYIGLIHMPMLSVQKDSVRKILGEHGENLTGFSVEDYWDSKIIETRFNFKVNE